MLCPNVSRGVSPVGWGYPFSGLDLEALGEAALANSASANFPSRHGQEATLLPASEPEMLLALNRWGVERGQL